MKRLAVLLALVVSCFAFAATASANVFLDNPGEELKVKFTGVEYVYNTTTGEQVTDVEGLLTGPSYGGLSMTGIFYVESIDVTDGAGKPTENRPYDVYNDTDTKGVYVGLLTGLTSSGVSESTDAYNLSFEGGVISWYYLDASYGLSLADLQSLAYDAANDQWTYGDGNILDLSAPAFVTYDLFNAAATIYKNSIDFADNELTAGFKAVGAVAEGSENYDYFDNNSYNGGDYDITLSASLEWKGSQNDHFIVNDPALLRTAPTPEPGTFVLMSAGLLLTAFFIRRKQKSNV